MTTLRRIQIAFILTLFALAPLAGVVVDAYLNWSSESSSFKLITTVLALLFAICVGICISIAADRKLDDIPWAKLGLYFLCLALGAGVAWARTLV